MVQFPIVKRLSPQVIVVSVVSLLNDAASEMIFPLLPLFITTYLGGTPFVAGAMEGFADALASLLKYWSGKRSDRMTQRKPLIIAGYGIAAAARLIIAAATVWPMVFAARLLDRTGKGIRSAPRDALIADVTEEDQRGRAFGLHRAMDHAGAIIGPLIAAGLLAYGLSLRQVFFAAIVPVTGSLLLLAFLLREPERHVPVKSKFGATDATTPLPPQFRRAVTSVALFALANSSDIFLLLQASRAGVSAKSLPLLWSAHHVLKVILNERAGALSDRIDRRWLLLSGWLLYAAIYFIFPFAHSLTAMLVLFIVYAIPFGLTEGAERAWVVSSVEPQSRGRAFGVYYLLSGVCTLGGTLAFGGLYELGGARPAFWSAGAVAVIAAFSLFASRTQRA